MERQETLKREHSEEYKAALQRAVSLAVPHAYSPSQYGTFSDHEEGENSSRSSEGSSYGSSKTSKKKESWDEVIERLLRRMNRVIWCSKNQTMVTDVVISWRSQN
ncbi:hypothetical protein CK203_019518 [Vitis vinifera]|uniref:Uncharacterized protein n=1 Tax=Vitis vinifera TaxID=29760 RepID=A0A438IYY7_VITVI|nr:hypothetical protein CK203_019518 [Vitis vinifera]